MDKVSEMLMKMGVYPNVKGFDYIKQAIKMDGPTIKMYEKIAQDNSDTAMRVERAIRHAISIAAISNYYKKLMFTDKTIKSSEFICALRMYITIDK